MQLLVPTIVITSVAALAALHTSRAYYAIAPFHYDSASYRATALRMDEILQRDGLRTAIVTSFRLRDGLDVTLRILLAPASLRSAWGHLVILLPFMGLFLFLVGLYVFERTGSLALVVSIQALVFASPAVFDPMRGIADYWKDNLGTWLLGAAAAAWLLSGAQRRTLWLAVSGALMGLLTWQRTVAAALGLAAFALPFVWEFLRLSRRSGIKPAFRAALAFLTPLALVGGPAMLVQWREILFYYSVAGYAYGHALDVARYLIEMGSAGSLTFVAIAGAWFLLALRGRSNGGPAPDRWTTAAWAAGLPLAVIASGGLYHGFVVAWTPLLMLLVASWIPSQSSAPAGPVVAPLAVVVLCASVAQASVSIARANAHALSAASTRAFDDELARLLAGRRYGLLFYDPRDILLNHAVFHHGVHLRPSETFTTIHDSFYAAVLPGLTVRQVVGQNVDRLEAEPGTLAVAHCSPEGIPPRGRLGPQGQSYGAFAGRVAARSARTLQRRPRWRVIRRFDTAFGCIAVHEYDGR